MVVRQDVSAGVDDESAPCALENLLSRLPAQAPPEETPEQLLLLLLLGALATRGHLHVDHRWLDAVHQRSEGGEGDEGGSWHLSRRCVGVGGSVSQKRVGEEGHRQQGQVRYATTCEHDDLLRRPHRARLQTPPLHRARCGRTGEAIPASLVEHPTW